MHEKILAIIAGGVVGVLVGYRIHQKQHYHQQLKEAAEASDLMVEKAKELLKEIREDARDIKRQEKQWKAYKKENAEFEKRNSKLNKKLESWYNRQRREHPEKFDENGDPK